MKRRNLRAVAVAAVGAMMVTSLAACGGTDGKNSTESGSNSDVTTLKWIQVGSGMPANYEDWQKNINKYLGDKIGVNLDVEVISWGDWDNKRSAIINTNEDYDILFTNSGTYASDVRLGAYYDISELVKSETPDLYASIPEDYWNATKIDGKIYAVPTYKDSSATQYFVWDKALAEKYNIDYENLTTLDALTDGLTAMAEGEKTAPFVLNNNGLSAITEKRYDALSLGLPAIGVSYDDSSKKVVSVFEQDDIMSDLKTLNKWYNAGIINADAATLAENPSYRSCFVAQGWSLAAKTTWSGQMGVDAAAVQWGDTVVSNDTVGGSLSCISANCKNPEKALALLELVNTDSYLRDALYYGLEGENFEYTADKKVKKLNEDWTMAGYTQGTFFNVSQLDGEEVNQWDEVKELNENAKPSPVLGVSIDPTDFSDELANCTEIFNRYKSELLTGTKEPEAEVAAMMKEMRAAGFDKIIEEVQKQVDASK